MKIRLSVLILILACSGLFAQQSFEGFVKFSTEISTAESQYKELGEMLQQKYGDGLLMYYSQNGDFRRVYLNSGIYGNDSQFYKSEKDELYITNRYDSDIQTLNVKENSLKLASRGWVKNQTIMGLDCKCYEFKAFDDKGEYAILTYCYNPETPEVNPELFSTHVDFFMDEYYKISRRPYLKFVMELKEFSLTYTAIKLKKKKLEAEVFELE